MARSVPAGAGDALKMRQQMTPLADALDSQRINRLAHASACWRSDSYLRNRQAAHGSRFKVKFVRPPKGKSRS